MLIFFYAGLFTCFSAWIRWCVLKTQALPPVKNQKTFLLATLNPSFIDFKYIKVLEILSSWRLGSADAWPASNKMLCMICYMLCCTHLHDRYDKSDFFFSDFISLLSCFRGISAKLSKQYYLKLFAKYIFSAALGSGCRNAPSPLLKICHTYPKMIKLSTVIPYLTKIQNIYKSRDTAKFCWHQ